MIISFEGKKARKKVYIWNRGLECGETTVIRNNLLKNYKRHHLRALSKEAKFQKMEESFEKSYTSMLPSILRIWRKFAIFVMIIFEERKTGKWNIES